MKYIATDEPIKDGYPNITHDSWYLSRWGRVVNPNVIEVVNDDGSIERKRLCMNSYGHYYLCPLDGGIYDNRMPMRVFHAFTGKPDNYRESEGNQDERDWRKLYALADVGSHMYWFRSLVLDGMPRKSLSEIVNISVAKITRAESWKATRDYGAWMRLDYIYGQWMETFSTDVLPSDEGFREIAKHYI